MTDINNEERERQKAWSILVLDSDDELCSRSNRHRAPPQSNNVKYNRMKVDALSINANDAPDSSTHADGNLVKASYSGGALVKAFNSNGASNNANDAFVFKTPEKPAKRSRSQSSSPGSQPPLSPIPGTPGSQPPRSPTPGTPVSQPSRPKSAKKLSDQIADNTIQTVSFKSSSSSSSRFSSSRKFSSTPSDLTKVIPDKGAPALRLSPIVSASASTCTASLTNSRRRLLPHDAPVRSDEHRHVPSNSELPKSSSSIDIRITKSSSSGDDAATKSSSIDCCAPKSLSSIDCPVLKSSLIPSSMTRSSIDVLTSDEPSGQFLKQFHSAFFQRQIAFHAKSTSSPFSAEVLRAEVKESPSPRDPTDASAKHSRLESPLPSSSATSLGATSQLPSKEKSGSSGPSSDSELSASEDEEDAGLKIVELENDPDLEKNINLCADKNNLGIRNIKQILKYVIKNKDVLEMVSSDMEQRTVESGTALTFEPKMTRARARQAFHAGEIRGDSSTPWIALTTPKKKKPTFTELVLNEDDEDEDFDPNTAEDEEEDDEDIDSLFSPNASNLASPCPSAHNLSLTSSRPEDDLSLPVENESSLRGQMSMAVVVGDRAGEVDKDAPAKRTRQNFSLKDKPLEVLEKALVAPDLDPEMFDSAAEDDVDTEYIDFLREFYTKPSSTNQPLIATASEAEASEREDDDPDYNIFEDMDQDQEADPEEYRQNKTTEVTKKELDELLSELFDGSNDEDDDTMDFLVQDLELPPPSPPPPPPPPPPPRAKKSQSKNESSSTTGNRKISKAKPKPPYSSNTQGFAAAEVTLKPPASTLEGETIFDPVLFTTPDNHQSPPRPTSLDTPSPPIASISTTENTSAAPVVSSVLRRSNSATTTTTATLAIDSYIIAAASTEDAALSTKSASSYLTTEDKSAPPPPPAPALVNPWPSDSLRSLLTQQLQQHVQLLTQSFVMCRTCAIPSLVSHVAEEAKQLINEIHNFSSQSGKASSFAEICNLVPAVEVVNELNPLPLGTDSHDENSSLRKAFKNDVLMVSSSQEMIRKKMLAAVPPLNAMRCFMMVPAFPYPNLFPESHILKAEDNLRRLSRKKPRKRKGEDSDWDETMKDEASDSPLPVGSEWAREKNIFSQAEDNLLAIGWVQYIEMNVSKSDAVRLIQKVLLPHRTTEALHVRMRNAINSKTLGWNLLKVVKSTNFLPADYNVDSVRLQTPYHSYDRFTPVELNGLITWYSTYKEAITLFTEKFQTANKKRPLPPTLSLAKMSTATLIPSSLFANPNSTSLFQQQQQQSSQNVIVHTNVNGTPIIILPPSNLFHSTPLGSALGPALVNQSLNYFNVTSSLLNSSVGATELDGTRVDSPLSVSSPPKTSSKKMKKRTRSVAYREEEGEHNDADKSFVTPKKNLFSDPKRIRILPIDSCEEMASSAPFVSASVNSAPLPLDGVALSDVDPAIPTSSGTDLLCGGGRWGTQLMDDILAAAMEEADIDAAAAQASSSPFKFLWTDSPFKTPLKTPFKTPTKAQLNNNKAQLDGFLPTIRPSPSKTLPSKLPQLSRGTSPSKMSPLKRTNSPLKSLSSSSLHYISRGPLLPANGIGEGSLLRASNSSQPEQSSLKDVERRSELGRELSWNANKPNTTNQQNPSVFPQPVLEPVEINTLVSSTLSPQNASNLASTAATTTAETAAPAIDTETATKIGCESDTSATHPTSIVTAAPSFSTASTSTTTGPSLSTTTTTEAPSSISSCIVVGALDTTTTTTTPTHSNESLRGEIQVLTSESATTTLAQITKTTTTSKTLAGSSSKIPKSAIDQPSIMSNSDASYPDKTYQSDSDPTNLGASDFSTAASSSLTSETTEIARTLSTTPTKTTSISVPGTPTSMSIISQSFPSPSSPPSFYSAGVDSPFSSQFSLDDSLSCYSDRTSYASDALETPCKTASSIGSDLETPVKGHVDSSIGFSPLPPVFKSPTSEPPASPRSRHLPSQSLARAAFMNSPTNKRFLVKVKTPLKKIAPKELTTIEAPRPVVVETGSRPTALRPILPKAPIPRIGEEGKRKPTRKKEKKTLKLKPASLSQVRKITPKAICEDAGRMPAEVFSALEAETQEEMNPGTGSVFAGVGEDLDLDQLMAASTTTNFTPSMATSFAPSLTPNSAPTASLNATFSAEDRLATSKAGATKKRGAGVGGGGGSSSGGSFAEEILKNMSDPSILENDPLSDERNAAYATAYLAKIRETVGPEHIDVYRSVLSLLRECAEEGDPVKLFHRLKRLLGEKWPQLIDEFVPFLQPEQAVECGVVLPYSHHLRVKRFFRKCEIFFSRRPSNYATLIKAFHNFSSKPMDGHLFTEVVNTVLPLLRGQKDLVQEFLSFIPNSRNAHAIPTDAHAYEEIKLDASNEETTASSAAASSTAATGAAVCSGTSQYLSDESGIVWEHISIEIDEEKDKASGSKKCPCRCHTNNHASQPFQNRLKHCIPCAKTIINGRYYIRTSAKQKEEADIVYIHQGRTKPLEGTELLPTDKRDNKENENPRGGAAYTATAAATTATAAAATAEMSDGGAVNQEAEKTNDNGFGRSEGGGGEFGRFDSEMISLMNDENPNRGQGSKESNGRGMEGGGGGSDDSGIVTLSSTISGLESGISGHGSSALSGIEGGDGSSALSGIEGGEACKADNDSFVFTVASGRAPLLAGEPSQKARAQDSTVVAEGNPNGLPNANVLVATAPFMQYESSASSTSDAVANAVSAPLSSESSATPPSAPAASQPAAQSTVPWTHEMDVTLLERCQNEGPSAATFERFVNNFRSAFFGDGRQQQQGTSLAECLKDVEARLLHLMEKLEAMQDEGSDSTEDEGDDDDEEEEEDESD